MFFSCGKQLYRRLCLQFCKSSLLDSHKTCFFLSSLELLLEVWRIWASGAQGARDKRPNGTKFVWDISWRLLGRFSWFESHMKSLWLQMCTGLVIFHMGPQGGLRQAHGPKSSLGFNICRWILGWFLRLWYIVDIWWHSTLGLFFPRAWHNLSLVLICSGAC